MACQQPLVYIIRQGDNLYHLSRYFKTSVQEILAMNPNIDPYNLKIGSSLTVCPGEAFAAQSYNRNPPSCPNPTLQFNLLKDMRTAWSQHVYWTRMLIISIVERLKDQDAVTNRLLKNPWDIANIFANYYTVDVAKAIAQLLTEHLQIGAALITALRDGRTVEAQNLQQQWYIQADKMAEAFGSINPYFNTEELKKMLRSHLDLTTQEVAMRIAGNYAADIEAFNKVEEQALNMADYFSSGIMNQFPQRFQ